MAGGHLIVEGAVELAHLMGIPELIVGLTVVAIGTSLPELATSIVAALRGEDDLMVGNIIGSNIFNIAAVLGVTSTIQTTAVPRSVLQVDLPAVLIFSFILVPLVLRDRRIHRREGVVLIGVYFLLALWIFS